MFQLDALVLLPSYALNNMSSYYNVFAVYVDINYRNGSQITRRLWKEAILGTVDRNPGIRPLRLKLLNKHSHFQHEQVLNPIRLKDFFSKVSPR